jgi:hypothetical protein
MKVFDASKMIDNREFRNLFQTILFESNSSNIAKLIKEFDVLYSSLLQIPPSNIYFEKYDYSYVDKTSNIYLGDHYLNNKYLSVELLKTYLHEKRHVIQHLSFENNDDTILKDNLFYVTANKLTTPISNLTYCDFGNIKHNYFAIPHEEDAFYHSNLELKDLINSLLVYAHKNHLHFKLNQRLFLRKVVSDCESTIMYYTDLEYLYTIKSLYVEAVSSFKKRYELEKAIVSKIKEGIDFKKIEIILDSIDECLSKEDSEKLKNLIINSKDENDIKAIYTLIKKSNK